MKRTLMVSALAAVLSLPAAVSAAEPAPLQEKAQAQQQVYGSQLMTPQERSDYRAKMRAAKTLEEREQIRKDHHEAMKERAKARGVTLPDEPPAQGGGMGTGGGMGLGGGRGR